MHLSKVSLRSTIDLGLTPLQFTGYALFEVKDDSIREIMVSI
jgi:hypothetical protein